MATVIDESIKAISGVLGDFGRTINSKAFSFTDTSAILKMGDGHTGTTWTSPSPTIITSDRTYVSGDRISMFDEEAKITPEFLGDFMELAQKPKTRPDIKVFDSLSADIEVLTTYKNPKSF